LPRRQGRAKKAEARAKDAEESLKTAQTESGKSYNQGYNKGYLAQMRHSRTLAQARVPFAPPLVHTRVTGRSVMGLPKTEVDVLVATHGWWPWLLTLFILILIACGVIAYFVKHRRAA
jgi:hypothetical protein